MIVLSAAGLVALAIVDLWAQTRVLALGEANDRQVLSLARGNMAEVRWAADEAPTARSPSGAAYRALILARAASTMPAGEDRRRLLEEAGRVINSARVDRPGWAEGDVTAAYVASLADDANVGADVLALLTSSYRAAGYMRQAGAWRVRVGLAGWDGLSADTREQVVDESVWLARSSDVLRDEVFARARDSRGYAAFARRWLAVRRGDEDLRAAGKSGA